MTIGTPEQHSSTNSPSISVNSTQLFDGAQQTSSTVEPMMNTVGNNTELRNLNKPSAFVNALKAEPFVPQKQVIKNINTYNFRNFAMLCNF